MENNWCDQGLNQQGHCWPGNHMGPPPPAAKTYDKTSLRSLRVDETLWWEKNRVYLLIFRGALNHVHLNVWHMAISCISNRYIGTVYIYICICIYIHRCNNPQHTIQKYISYISLMACAWRSINASPSYHASLYIVFESCAKAKAPIQIRFVEYSYIIII